jgi:DNA-binding HxlR family transcriptional regulator
VRRRDGDGCPVSGALQLIGDKWTMLVVRDLSSGPKRTTELLLALRPISSRTLVGRLRDMEHDHLIDRREFGGSPPRVEYGLTERGKLLLPLLESLRAIGEAKRCDTCSDRKHRSGTVCAACPLTNNSPNYNDYEPPRPQPRQRDADDSIILL